MGEHVGAEGCTGDAQGDRLGACAERQGVGARHPGLVGGHVAAPDAARPSRMQAAIPDPNASRKRNASSALPGWRA